MKDIRVFFPLVCINNVIAHGKDGKISTKLNSEERVH